jgi:dihydropteroate synthase type 2/dihydropteroate synthase type 3
LPGPIERAADVSAKAASMRGGAPKILGIVNITEDSFSDGGKYLEPRSAIVRALELVDDGADGVDLGAASSNPDAKHVAPDEEIRRLDPVVAALAERGIAVSIDTFKPEVQRWAARRRVAYINDIGGFPDAAVYADLAHAECKLIVMHSVQRGRRATRVETDAAMVIGGMLRFFEERIAALERAGVRRDRLVLDPGMGFFLGANVEPSLHALAEIPRLKKTFGLPIHVSVSRKSFLGTLTGRGHDERGAATLAAELYAASQGVDFIRTHEVRALADGLKVLAALANQ